MKIRWEGIKTPFIQGLLCGGITVVLLFVSWRLVLLAAGLAAIYFLLRKRG